MIRNKKMVTVLLIVGIVLLLGVTIAYSALSQNLAIRFSGVSQSAMTWDIGFQAGTVTGVGTPSSIAIKCGSATATSTTISGISTKLSKAGDRCSYTFQIVNNGTIDGVITAINITKPTNTNCTISGSTMVCGDITYKLHYDSASSSSLLAAGDVITAKSGNTPTTKDVVLTVEYTGATSSQVDFNQLGFSYTINYGQQ